MKQKPDVEKTVRDIRRQCRSFSGEQQAKSIHTYNTYVNKHAVLWRQVSCDARNDGKHA